MPIRDELIARTIEQLRQALAHLTLVEGSASHPTHVAEIRVEIERLYRAHVGSGSSLVHRLGSEDLLDVLRSAGSVDGERAYLLAALLEVDAAAVEHDASEDAADLAAALRVRALDLVLEAGLARVGETDLEERVERLGALVPPTWRRAQTWDRLHRFALERGAYARAEDALFAWLAHEPGDAVARAGTGFYEHLRGLRDDELEAGDLPRDEVDEGRDAFGEALREADARP
jgi:hypothetical protein